MSEEHNTPSGNPIPLPVDETRAPADGSERDTPERVKQAVEDLASRMKKAAQNDPVATEALACDLAKRSALCGLEYEYAESLACLGFALSERGHPREALLSIAEALEILRRFPRTKGLSRGLMALGNVHIVSGEFDKAMEVLMEALDLSREIGDQEPVANILLNLGNILYWRGEYTRALEYYMRSSTEAELRRDRGGQISALNNMGAVANALGYHVEATDYLTRCIAMCREGEDESPLCTALDDLALAKQGLGEATEAEATWLEAIGIAEKKGLTTYLIPMLINLSNFYLQEGRYLESGEYLDRGRVLAEGADSKIDRIRAYRTGAELHERLGEYPAAIYYLKRQFALEKEVDQQKATEAIRAHELATLRTAQEQLENLGEIGRSITGTLDRGRFLDLIHGNVERLMDVTTFAIASYDEATREIVYEQILEDGKPVPGSRVPLDDGRSLAAWCARNRKEIVMSDSETQSAQFLGQGAEHRLMGGKGSSKMTHSLLFAPLVVEDRLIGVMTIQSDKIDAYSLENVQAFRILASYAAIGLNNALQAERIREQNGELQRLATTDVLTGLDNRRAFFDKLGESWSLSTRTGTPLSLLIMDVDHFKRINDRMGHPAGDYCLKEMAGLLSREIARSSDVLGRIGGEEFGVLLVDSDEDGAVYIAERLRLAVESHDFSYEGKRISLTISLGLRSLVPRHGDEAGMDGFFSEADTALYDAKKRGRNRVSVFGSEG